MLPDDVFIFFFFFFLAWVWLRLVGLSRKKERYVYSPADLEVALSEIWGGIAKKKWQWESEISQGPPYGFD
jgi:hypothetical protein